MSWDFSINNTPNINLPSGATSVSFNTGGTLGTSGCTGNGISNSGWNVGEYFQIVAPTMGYNIMNISFNVRSSGTGPGNFKIQYSSTGSLGTFTDLPGGTFSSGNGVCVARGPFDLSAINSINNNSNSVIRLVFTGGEADGSPATGDAQSAGTFRIDDIIINGTPTCSTGSFTGSTGGNWSTASNWCGGSVPASSTNVVIPANTTVNLDASTTTIANLTIDGTLVIGAGNALTLTGNLTNNGTLTLENGATLVQGASSSYSGTGTVQVKQNITGANNGSSPNGRFWYLGSPVAGGLSSILDAAGANVVKYWDEPSAAWVEITDNTSALTVGRGHYLRSFTPGNQTLTFTGGVLNNGTYTFPLSANGSSFNGFNLVSNPYPSYLKWDDVAKTNVGTTVWYRTSNGANNMVFDTYNSNGNVGTSNNGVGTVSQFIPPMQAFWVKVEGNTSGSIVLENIDRSHHVSGMQGMHSLLDKQMFANINLIKDTMRDQAIVYSSYATADVFDAYDSEKMFQANTPQLYSKINDKKVVINAKNFTQRNEKTPLYMNIPSAGTYTMQLGEFNSSFGSIWLEDLSNGQLQNLLINDTYTFQTEAGQDLARFVLHFGYPEQIYGAEVFESVEDNFDSPVNWDAVSVLAADDKIIDLTASLNEIDAQQTRIVSVFDMTGRQIMSGSFENGNNQIQVPASNAVYMVHVTVGSAHKVFKVLIQQ